MMRDALGARGTQQVRDPRARTANEGYRAELSTGVDSGIHGIQIASSARVVANERRDFHESITLHVEHQHVVQRRYASLVSEPGRHVRPKAVEIDRRSWGA